MGNYNQPDQLSPLILPIANTNDFNSIKESMYSLIKQVPLDQASQVPLKTVFATFSIEQIEAFSNNLILAIKSMMNDKLNYLVQAVELTLAFIDAVYEQFKTMRDIVPVTYDKIIKKKEESNSSETDCIEIIKNAFPYNVFIFSVEVLNNDEFMFKKDVFQRELDKFEFILRLTAIIFYMLHHRDIPIKKNSQSSTTYLDSFKVLIMLNETFISKKIQKSFLQKVYNTSIHNLENLINGRVDPNITTHKFDLFLFMNLYILNFFLCDITKLILSEENKSTFNIKTIQICSLLLKKEEKELPSTINEYNLFIKESMDEIVTNSANFFRKFVLDFYCNEGKLSVEFKTVAKILIIYIFEKNINICEMICLSDTILLNLMGNISLSNAYDVMILYLLSKTVNFYISMKHLEQNIETLCQNCLNTIITNRKEDNNKFTFSAYFSLLCIKNFSLHMSELPEGLIEQLGLLFEYLSLTELTTENFFDNLICLTIFYEIVLSMIGHLDYPAKLIYSMITKKESIEKCKEKYHLFYKNNFELSSRGKKIWASYIVFEGNSEKFIKEIENKVNDSKEDIKYSTESIVIGIINKSVYKQNELLNKKNAFVIYGGDIEKFLISTMHTIEEFKIIA